MFQYRSQFACSRFDGLGLKVMELTLAHSYNRLYDSKGANTHEELCNANIVITTPAIWDACAVKLHGKSQFTFHTSHFTRHTSHVTCRFLLAQTLAKFLN